MDTLSGLWTFLLPSLLALGASAQDVDLKNDKVVLATTLSNAFNGDAGVHFEASHIDGKQIIRDCDGLFGKRGEHGFAVVLRYGDGTPYLYANDSFALVYDSRTPGQVKRFDDVSVILSVQYDKGGLALRVALSKAIPSTEIRLDFSQLHRESIAGDKEFLLDPLRNIVNVRGDNTAFAFSMVPRSRWLHELAVMRAELASETGKLLRVNTRDPGVAESVPYVTMHEFQASELARFLVASKIPGDVPVLQTGKPPERDREMLSTFQAVLMRQNQRGRE